MAALGKLTPEHAAATVACDEAARETLVSKAGETGGPRSGQRTFVVTSTGEGAGVARKPAVAVAKTPAKPKWVIQASVSPPVRKPNENPAATESNATGSKGAELEVDQMNVPSPQPVATSQTPFPPVALSLPPGLEDLAARLVKPMIGEWLNVNLPILIGKALAGKR